MPNIFKKERFKIDAGSNLGVAKGDKICSYEDSGEEAAYWSGFLR